MLQSDPLDLGRVDDPGPYHVHVLIRLGVEPLREVLGAPDLLHDDGPLEAGILHDLSEWLLERSPHDVDAGRLIAGEREAVESRRGSEQSDPAARHDPPPDPPPCPRPPPPRRLASRSCRFSRS